MEIKFRGLSHSSGWVYGSYIHSKRFVGCGNEHRIFNQDTGLESDVIGETVGQFTGLTDKNGKEIYSGDIVRQSDNLCIIERCVGGYECQMLIELKKGGFIEGSTYDFSFLSDKYCEVIGNIFEHSELLKK